MVKSSKKISLLDLVDVEFLQRFQDAFAKATGVGAVTVDEKGLITKPSNFNDFCNNTMTNIKGHEKCTDCDLKWGAIAAEKKEPVIYKCFAGLTVFVVPIIVEGNYVAAISGGLVFTQKPKKKLYRKLAQELDIDEEKYIEIVNKVPIISEEKIKAYADLLFIVANAISRIAHKRFVLSKKTEEENISRQIIEKIRSTLDADEIKKYFIKITRNYFNADRCLFVEYDSINKKFFPIKYEELKTSKMKSLVGVTPARDLPEFNERILKGKNLIIKDLAALLSRRDFSKNKSLMILKKAGVKSNYALTVLYQGKIIGIFVLQFCDKQRSLTHNEFSFLKLLRDHAGIALYQAELYEMAKKNAEKEALIRNISETIRKTLDIHKTKKAIVKEVGKALNADRVFIVEFDPQTNTPKILDKYSENLSVDVKSLVGYDFASSEIAFLSNIHKKKEPIILQNSEEYILKNNLAGSQVEAWLRKYEVKSGIGMPLIHGEKILGVLSVHYTKSVMPITLEYIKLFEEISNQTGIALYQARLFEDKKNVAEREILLRNIIETVRMSLDINETKRKIVEFIGKTLDADRCYIVDYDKKSDKFLVIRDEYLSSSDIKPYSGINVNVQLPNFAAAVKSGEMVLVNDKEIFLKSEDQKFEPERKIIEEYNINSAFAFPLYYSNQLLGVLAIHYVKKQHTITQDEINLISAAANQVATAIHQAKLYYITQSQAEREFLLRKITETIRSSLNIVETKKKIVDILGETIGADRCFIMDYDKANEKFLIVKDEYVSSAKIPAYIGNDVNIDVPNFVEGLKRGESLIVNNKEIYLNGKQEHFVEEKAAIEKFGVKAAYAIPFFYNNELLGALGVHYLTKQHEVTEEELNLIKDTADQIATAIYQAELYEKTQINAERERVIRAIIEKAISTENEEEIIKTIVTEEGKLFKADRCFFIEYSQELDTSLPIKEYAEYLSSDYIKTHVTRAPKRDEVINFLAQTKKNKMVAVSNINKIYLPEPSKKMLIDDLGVKSYLIAPVFYGQIFYGSMVLHYVNDFMEFSQEQIDMAHLVANQFASVLYQSKLHMMNKINAEREKILRKIISTVISTFDFSNIKDLVTDVGKITKADRCYFVETDLENYRGKPLESDNEYLASDDVKTIMGYQFPEGDVRDFVELYIHAKDLAVFDYENLQKMTEVKYDGIKKYSSIFDLKSGIGVPFIYEGKPVAVLCIEYVKQKVLPTTEELDFLRLLGQQVGVAYTQIKLYNDSKKTAEREILLRKIIEAIRSSLDINEVIHTFVFEIGKILKAEKVFYSKYDESNNTLLTPDENSEYRESDSILKYCDMAKILDDNFPAFAEIIKATKQRMIIPDISEFLKEKGLENSIDNESIKKYNFNTAIALPVVYKDKLLGFYGIEYKDATYLDKSTIDFLTTLSEQTVIAMNQANLYDKEKQMLQRETILRKIIETVRSSLILKEVQKQITYELGKAFNADRCYFRYYVKSTNAFLPPVAEYLGAADVKSLSEVELKQLYLKYLSEDVKKLHKGFYPIVIDEKFAKNTPFESYLRENNIKADYTMPISDKQDEQCWLVMHFSKDAPNLNKEDEKILEIVAYQIDIAFEQIKLYSLVKKKAESEALLRDITEKIRSSLDIEEILSFICEESAKIFNVQRTSITVFPDSSNYEKFILRKEYTIDSTTQSFANNQGRDFSKIAAYWGKKLIESEPLLAFDDIEKADVPDYFKDVYSSLGAKALMGTAIRKGKDVWGTLVLTEYNQPRIWSEEEKKLLKSIANQVYIAINQAELFDKEKKSAEREIALRKILSIARTSLNIQEIKRTVIEETCKYFGADRGFFYEIDEKRNPVINVEYVSSALVNKMSEVSLDKIPVEYWNRVMFDEDFASGTFISDLKKYIMDNNLEGTLVDEHRKLFNIKTAIGLPISYAKDVYGELIIQFTIKHYEISEQDKEFLRILADQFALTLNQAKLYDEAEKKAESENLLRKIYETMRSSLDINIIKNTIVNEVGKALGADICFILSYKANEDSFEIDEYSEYRASPDEKSYILYDVKNPNVNFFMNSFRKNKEIRYSNVEEFIILNNLQGTPEERHLREYNIKSSYDESIYYANTLFGYILVQYTKYYRELTDNEIKFLKTITTQAGIAFYQAQLYKKIQKQAEREKINRSIIEILRSTFDKDYIINIFVRTIGNFFKADRVFLSEYDSEARMYKPVTQGAEFLSSPTEKSFVGYDWSGPESAEYIGPLLNKKELNIQNWEEYIPNNAKSHDFIILFEDANVKSSYNLPILYQERLMGYFCIEFTQRYFKMDDEDMTLIRSICRQCGIALYQAELYQKTQEKEKPEFIKDYTARIKESLGEIIDLSQISPEQYEEPMVLFEKINALSKNLLEITNEML